MKTNINKISLFIVIEIIVVFILQFTVFRAIGNKIINFIILVLFNTTLAFIILE